MHYSVTLRCDGSATEAGALTSFEELRHLRGVIVSTPVVISAVVDPLRGSGGFLAQFVFPCLSAAKSKPPCITMGFCNLGRYIALSRYVVPAGGGVG